MVAHSNKKTGPAAIALETEWVLNEDHKRKARCNAVRSKATRNEVGKVTARHNGVRNKVARKRKAPPSVDCKQTGRHNAVPPEAKALIRVAVFSEGKLPTVVGGATRLVEVMRLVSGGHAPRRDTPPNRDHGSANADPQHHKAAAAVAAPGR